MAIEAYTFLDDHHVADVMERLGRSDMEARLLVAGVGDQFNSLFMAMQNAMGVESGDVAALFFSGREADAVHSVVHDVIEAGWDGKSVLEPWDGEAGFELPARGSAAATTEDDVKFAVSTWLDRVANGTGTDAANYPFAPAETFETMWSYVGSERNFEVDPEADDEADEGSVPSPRA